MVKLSASMEVRDDGLTPSAVTDERLGDARELADPENQEDFGLAALRLVEQDKRAIQGDAISLAHEHPEELEVTPDGLCKFIHTFKPRVCSTY